MLLGNENEGVQERNSLNTCLCLQDIITKSQKELRLIKKNIVPEEDVSELPRTHSISLTNEYATKIIRTNP